MKEVTFKNVKCKTGGLIPRKGDARHKRYPSIEMTVEINKREESDTAGMDSVWLAIKTSWKTNDDSRTKLSKMEAARKEVVPSMVVSRCRLMRSLREDNVDLPYVRMKL
ncbi:hypothetical protein AgCh_006298 [Apium graveolens]